MMMTCFAALALAQPILKATYMTPGTVLDMISLNDNYCHMWLAVEETLQRIPPGVSLKDPEYVNWKMLQCCLFLWRAGTWILLSSRHYRNL